jgi:hypothetical protein
MIRKVAGRGGWLAVGTVLWAALAAGPAAAQRFDWSELGTEFCAAAILGEPASLAPVLTPSLNDLVQAAARRPDVPPRMLVQSYDAEAPRCEVRTRNAALVEITRVTGDGTRWTDYLVVVPEADGSTRIDDILFSTRRSDTLRARLGAVLRR